jgi:hypothetical protein
MGTIDAGDNATDFIVERRRCCLEETSEVNQNLNDPSVDAKVRWAIYDAVYGLMQSITLFIAVHVSLTLRWLAG